jgi:hypothetical protein
VLRAIFYKEYLKIRWLFLALLVLNALLAAYVYVDIRHLFVMDHAEMVWYRVVHIGREPYGVLRYALVVTGALTACIQYLPEMVGERLRLSLHLPVSPHALILAHVLVGAVAVGLASGLDLLSLAVIMSRYFPSEAVASALLTALPWGLGGLAAYLGVTLALLEPGSRRRVFNLAVAAGVLALFLRHEKPGAYGHVLIGLCVLICLMIPSVLLPGRHFRFRRVSQ